MVVVMADPAVTVVAGIVVSEAAVALEIVKLMHSTFLSPGSFADPAMSKSCNWHLPLKRPEETCSMPLHCSLLVQMALHSAMVVALWIASDGLLPPSTVRQPP